MLKQVHKIFLILFLGYFLSFPSAVFAETDAISVVQEVSQNSETEFAQHDIHVEETHTGPLDTGSIKESVVPDPSKEGKKVIGLFFKTMAAVMFCSVLLFFILFFVLDKPISY